MNNIVIVGCGTQAMKHLECYAKLRKKFDIRISGLVDPEERHIEHCKDMLIKKSFDLSKTVAAASIDQIRKKTVLQHATVDIITPNHLHYSTAEAAMHYGAKNLIIEKPLAHRLVEAKRFSGLNCNIGVMENYLFSALTKSIYDYVSLHLLSPIFVKTEFSKDRRLDSAGGRGTGDAYVPHVFEVEMPHQIAIVRHILGAIDEISDAWHHDMILPDGRISNHGEGAITLMHANKIPSYNFSCLQGFRHMPINYRNIRIYCSDKTKIIGFYPTTMDLDASLFIYKENRMVHREVLKDDSLANSLEYTLHCFERKSPLMNGCQFGLEIMRIIEKARSLARKSH